MQETDPRSAVDIAFRRRCLKVNTAIYARRFGRAALALMPEGSAIRRRLAADVVWMSSEQDWTPNDQRRVAMLCAEMLRHGRRASEPLEYWWWHVARLRELLRQYETTVAIERQGTRRAVWPSRPAQARGKKTARLRARQRRR